jgi:hypothetical protein
MTISENSRALLWRKVVVVDFEMSDTEPRYGMQDAGLRMQDEAGAFGGIQGWKLPQLRDGLGVILGIGFWVNLSWWTSLGLVMRKARTIFRYSGESHRGLSVRDSHEAMVVREVVSF